MFINIISVMKDLEFQLKIILALCMLIKHYTYLLLQLINRVF